MREKSATTMPDSGPRDSSGTPAPSLYARPLYARPLYARPLYARPLYARPLYARPLYGHLSANLPGAGAPCQAAAGHGPARAGDLGVRPGLPQRPVRRDLPRRPDQPWQVVVDQGGDARLSRVHGHVHGRPDFAFAVPHGYRDRADAGGQLLVGQGPAPGPDRAQLVVDVTAVARRGRRQAGPAGLRQRRRQRLAVQRGEQHLALGRLQGREPRADDNPEGNDLRHRHTGDVDDVRAVQLGHRGGLAGLADELGQMRAGDVPQAERSHVGQAQPEHLRGEGEGAVRLPDKSELGQGQQEAPGGGPGQAGGLGDLGQAHPGVTIVEAGQDVQAPRECLDEVGPGAASGHAHLLAGARSDRLVPAMFAQRTAYRRCARRGTAIDRAPAARARFRYSPLDGQLYAAKAAARNRAEGWLWRNWSRSWPPRIIRSSTPRASCRQSRRLPSRPNGYARSRPTGKR